MCFVRRDSDFVPFSPPFLGWLCLPRPRILACRFFLRSASASLVMYPRDLIISTRRCSSAEGLEGLAVDSGSSPSSILSKSNRPFDACTLSPHLSPMLGASGISASSAAQKSRVCARVKGLASPPLRVSPSAVRLAKL